MDGIVNFKTDNGNNYMYSYSQKQVMLNNPIIYSILNSDEKDDLVIEKLTSMDNIVIDAVQLSQKEIQHYCNKYLFLRENHFFDEIEQKKILSGRVTADSIEKQLKEVDILTFEVTENCNLRCEYCVYGEHYNIHEDRLYYDLDIEKSKMILEFFKKQWMSNKSDINKRKVIGFYGGEALLKFDFIKEIVDYSRKISIETGLKFQYNITTNAILLDKYMDYLVENDFWVLISIDGNRENNSYRVFKNKQSSFDILHKNICLIKEKYPVYFKENVFFNAVLHNRNDEKDVIRYIKSEFDKKIQSSLLKSGGDAEEKAMNYSPKTDLYKIESMEDKEDFMSSGNPLNFYLFIEAYMDNLFKDFKSIRKTNLNNKKFYPTGTCLPFGKKVFVTAQGNILPCERINFRFVLGKVLEDKIEIDTQIISDMYNSYYDRINSLCAKCSNFLFCNTCMLSEIIQDDDSLMCKNYMNKNNFSDFFSSYWSFFEKNPNVVFEILNTIKYA